MASVVFVVDLYIRPGGAVIAEHVHLMSSCTIPRTAVVTNCVGTAQHC
jgi:hypothetical protein